MTNEQLDKYNSMIWDEWSKAVKKHPKFCDSMLLWRRSGAMDARCLPDAGVRLGHTSLR